ncbi:acetate--CoA ligase family protein [Candidimonas nitroreducens]|nr:acetate--CoA ligase family protein [Candidimonas nitroreducens]
MASIDKMLNPSSIVVVGATPRMQYGGKFFTRVLSYKDRIQSFAVNPNYDDIFGERCYHTVADLPITPDLAVVIVPYHAVLATLKECHAKGIRAAIVISAGFSERGDNDRKALQDELTRYARESGIRISGPNCLGLANIRDDLWLTSSSRIKSGIPGNVGVICQSGASLFGPILSRAHEQGIGMSYAVSTGNEADLDFSDFARYMIDDPNTRVIAGFIEGFKDGRKFLEVAKLAADRGKPIVLIKIGRSAQGSRAAGSHTAAMTGADELYDAVCRQYGILRLESYDELLEIANFLAKYSDMKTAGVGLVSNSGGVISFTADMLGKHGISLPPLSDQGRERIAQLLKGFGAAANPADITGKASGEDFGEILGYMLDEPEIGTMIVACAGGNRQIEQIIEANQARNKPVAYLWTGSRHQDTGLPMLKAAGIPVFYNPATLAKGLRHLADLSNRREKGLATSDGAKAIGLGADQRKAVETACNEGARQLSEARSKSLLQAWDIPITEEQVATSSEQAAAIAARVGYPVVLKIASADIPHKTEIGGVQLDLCNKEQVVQAYDRIQANAQKHAPAAKIDGVLVQRMLDNSIEVIAGISYDEQLGPTLLVGAGGIHTELYRDVTLRACPVTPAQALDMLQELKIYRLLQGFRNVVPGDIQALIDSIVKLSHMAVQLEGVISEVDLNPILVQPQGQGAIVADALITLKTVEEAQMCA